MDEIAATSLRLLNMVGFDRATAEKQAAARVEMDDAAEYAKLKGDSKDAADDLIRQAEELPAVIAKAIDAQAKLDHMYFKALLRAGFIQGEAVAIVAGRGTAFLTQ